MNDASHIFHTADLHFAARAAHGRVEAINACPNLHWLVTATCEGVDRQFAYDHAPSFTQIVRDTRASGLWGEVQVRSITVGRKRQRRLILMPWLRVKAQGNAPLPIAAE
ncbi:hypothetical protein [Gemmobacter sp.]|uniref:hypothetical protein n=1 Tax=Gemmobacter sp. TaxID=1898957 RepID=UPI002AFF0E1B|nr:hypothetical protein [Gemmobacter sp.]